MRMHRLIHILLLLERENKVTAQWLAKELETSVRTIYRDIEILCEAGIPICTEAGKGGGISLMEGYQTQVKHLDKEDIIYLYLNGMGVKAERSSLLEQQTSVSLKKLEKDLPFEQVEELHGLIDRFMVDNSPWWGEKQPISQIDLMMQAVFQLHKLQFIYRKVDQSTSQRVVRPYGIVIKENIWYLVGYCEQSTAIRTFRCDRMEECRLMEEHFLYPKEFELKKYFETSVKEFKHGCAMAEQYPVTMTVSRSALGSLKGMEYTVLEEKEEECRICVNLFGLENALRDYWNLLIDARFVKPEELRQTVIKKLHMALEHYEG